MAWVMYKEKGLFSEGSWSGTSGIGSIAYGDSTVSCGKAGQTSQYVGFFFFFFSFLFVCVDLFFETEPHVAHAGLKLAM